MTSHPSTDETHPINLYIQRIVLLSLSVWLMGFFLSCEPTMNQNRLEIPLTAQEKSWLKSQSNIIIAPDPNFPPVEFFNENKEYIGIAADFIDLVEKRLNIHLNRIQYQDWDDIISEAKQGKIDILGGITETRERSKFLLFTKPYIELPSVIIVRRLVEETLNLEQLAGMRIAVASNSVDQEYLRENYKELQLDPVINIQIGLRKVSFGMADAMVTNLASATYFIEKEGITNLRISEQTGYIHKISMAIRKDLPILKDILDKSLESITEQEKKVIYKNWIHLENERWITWQRFILIILIVIGTAALIIIAILGWNRSLQQKVTQRTLDLEKELTVRLQVEKDLFKSQEKYRELTENTNDIVLSYDPQGIVTYIGPQVINYGYDPEEIISHPIIDFLDPQDVKRVLKDFQKTIEKGLEFPTEFRLKSKDLKTIWFEERGKIQRDRNGHIRMISGVLRDITKRKKAEEKLKKSLTEKEIILKEVYHRVKNNLQVVSSLLHLQANSIKNNKFRAMFQESQDRVNSMALIHQKLYQSKDLAKVDFSGYLRSLTKHLFLTYGSDTGHVDLKIQVEDIALSLDLAIPCGLIVNEIISNALKYAFPPEYEKKGVISVSLRYSGKSTLQLILQDNGVGLPANLDIQNTQSLGLRLIHMLTQNQLHGKLNVDTKQGTCYTIQFNIA